MKIEIADRSSAFSHALGHEAMIPGTFWKVRAYPGALFISSCSTLEEKKLFFDIQGPVTPFTVEQDIDKALIRIYGQSRQGYFRFLLQKERDNLIFFVEKTPEGGIQELTERGEKKAVLAPKDKVILTTCLECSSPTQEKLFLGSNKQKDWDEIRSRRDLGQILSLWFRLGQVTPKVESKEEGPALDLLQELEERVDQLDRNIEDKVLSLYLAGLTGGLVPRAVDEEFQGIFPLGRVSQTSNLSLLTRGSCLIRSLFFREKGKTLFILPCVPSVFVSGRMLDVMTNSGIRVNLEWTKHRIRRVLLIPESDASIFLQFPSSITSYRVRTGLKERGKVILPGDVLVVKKGIPLWVDRFLK